MQAVATAAQQGRRARTEALAGPRRPPEPLWKTEVLGVWNFIRTQPTSFWLINIYLFIEYVRPQSVYPVLDIFPWARIAVLGALAALLLEGRVIRLGHTLSYWYVAFIAVVLLSSVTAWRPALSWDDITLPLSWFLIFVLITNTINTERRFYIFMLAFLLYSLKMSQHGARSWAAIGFGFRDWGAVGGPGWFHNSGEFGIQMCIFFPVALYFVVALRPYWPRWKTWLLTLMPITAVMSMIASSARGAIIGGALVLAWIVVRSRYRVRAAVAVGVVATVAFVFIPEGQMERLEAMGEDDTSVARLTMWEDGIEIANDHPTLGIGYNNWVGYYRRYYGGRQVPHNPFIEAWAELGYAGLLVFLALIVGTFVTNRKTRKLAKHLGERGRFLYYMGWGLDGALVGFVGAGFFVSVLHYPFFWINLAMTVSLSHATRAKAREIAAERQGVPAAVDAGARRARPGRRGPRPVGRPAPAGVSRLST